MTDRLLVPDLVEVDRIPADLDRVVDSSMLDFNGHVNVRGYFDLHMTTADAVFEELGMDEVYRARTGCSLFSLDHRIAYVDELVEGQHVTVHVAFTDVSDAIVRGWSAVVNRSAGVVSNVLHFVEAGVSLERRRLEPFAEPFASSLRQRLVTPPLSPS